MSVTIRYRPINGKDPSFKGGTSDSLEKLKEIFGTQINPGEDVRVLRGMAKATKYEFYDEVADAVETLNVPLTFWGEW